MKILMVVSRLNIGGTEKYIISISRYLTSRGVRVGIASLGGPLENSCKDHGIPIHLFAPQKDTLFNRVSSLSSIITKEKYEILHVHDSKSFRYAAALHRKHKIHTIATVHGTYHDHSSLLSMSKVVNNIITVSPKLSKWLIGKKIATKK